MLAVQAGCVHLTPTPEPVTITFQCAEEEEEHVRRLIEAFAETHGYITVELVRPRRYAWSEADL
jgi:hypothetical protein